MQKWNTITSIAMLGTQRAPLPKESLWPTEESVAIGALGASSNVAANAGTRRVGESSSAAGATSASTTLPSVMPASADAAAVSPLAGSRRALSPEQTLLRAAAANYLWQIAGERAVEAALPVVEPAPGGAERAVSEPAAWRLARMLNGEHRELVPEWFALAAERRRLVPPQWLPVVLNALKPADRNQYSAVLGPHALWLAKQNPAWSLHAASAEPSEERWNNGTLDERRAELSALRTVDPARARTWIESTWKVDPPDAREEFLRVLLTGLSHDDEPLLEAALDDKRKGVRAAAAECLARLPNSAHAKRNYARLQPLIELQAKGTGLFAKLRSRRLDVQLPSSLAKADIRDGLELNPPANRKIGERTYWLEQMIAIARPAYWTERFDCDIQTFIDAALPSDYAHNLLLALSQAAVRHRDMAWIAALCAAWLKHKEPSEMPSMQSEMLIVLIAAVPQSERERLLDHLLDSLDSSRFDLAYALLTTADFSWSAGLTQRAFELLAKHIGKETQQWSHPVNTLLGWGRHADASTASAAIAGLLARSADASPWRNALEAMEEIIEFRTALKQELST
jgi:Family of unknown function (DUF5691)